MKNKFSLTFFFLALASAASITDNGDGTSLFSTNGPNRNVIGICSLPVDWETTPCSGSFKGKTFVDMEVCTQIQADAGDTLPMVTCTSGHVSNNLCDASWEGVKQIPQPGPCGKLADHYARRWLKDTAQNGLDKVKAQPPLASDSAGDWVDP